MVLGPSRDGGYYLVGMNRPIPEIFSGMSWSHDEVLAEDLVKLRSFASILLYCRLVRRRHPGGYPTIVRVWMFLGSAMVKRTRIACDG